MWSARLSRSAFVMLNVAAYLTLLTVAIPTLLTVPGRDRLWVAALLALFGLLVTLFQRWKEIGWSAHLYLLAQSLVVMTLILRFPGVGLGQVHLLFFVLSAYAMLMLPLRQGVIWIIVYFVFTMGVAGVVFSWEHALNMASVAGGHALFGGFGALLREAETERQQTAELLQELRSAHRQLQEYALQAEQLAVSEERNRLAREMHDALGHRLTVAVVQLEGAQRLIPGDPQRAAKMVGAMREQLREALGELRQSVAALRSPAHDALDLPEALARLTHNFTQATGLPVTLHVADALPALPAAHRLALYRAAQEALTNIQRHAAASRAWVRLSSLSLPSPAGREPWIALEVEDDGDGFASEVLANERGLRGLRERAAELFGDLALENGAAGGARVVLRLPVPPGEVDNGQ